MAGQEEVMGEVVGMGVVADTKEDTLWRSAVLRFSEAFLGMHVDSYWTLKDI